MKQSSDQTRSITSSLNTFQLKWLPALVPSIALGALVVVFWNQPPSQPIVITAVEQAAAKITLPRSSTLVVGTESTAQPIVLRGRLTVFDPQIVASPAAGMVARLLVEPGEMVKAGDTIAMISNQAVPAVEKSRVAAQERAEAAQEQANRQQSILQGKLAQEKVLLEAANQRVDKAAQRLLEARELLRRLQNGEKIPRSQVSGADTSHSSSVAQEPRKITQENTPDSTEALAKAQQQADKLAKVATQKWQILHVLLTRQQAAKASAETPNSQSAPSPAPSSDQIEAARADAKNAQDAADKARMEVYQLTSSKPTKKVKPAPSTDSSKSTFITISDATRIANAALQESNDAVADVKAIKRQIERYQVPVKSANSNFESATSHLENTQRSLFDNPVKVPMTPVIASTGGMVHRLATLAMHVDQGDEIASITPANLLSLDIRDSTKTWETLEVNSKFAVSVQTTSDPQKHVTTDARLVAITPPRSSGQPALLDIQVFNPVAQESAPQKTQAANSNTMKPRALPRVFSPGMIALFPISRADATIVVPRSALRVSDNNQLQIAVLKPQNDNEDYLVQWNTVTIKEDEKTSENITILSGLNKNDRIALQPEMLYHLLEAQGYSLSVQLENS